jgi:hypothetical protein
VPDAPRSPVTELGSHELGSSDPSPNQTRRPFHAQSIQCLEGAQILKHIRCPSAKQQAKPHRTHLHWWWELSHHGKGSRPTRGSTPQLAKTEMQSGVKCRGKSSAKSTGGNISIANSNSPARLGDPALYAVSQGPSLQLAQACNASARRRPFARTRKAFQASTERRNIGSRPNKSKEQEPLIICVRSTR